MKLLEATKSKTNKDNNDEMYLILILLRYSSIVILTTVIINRIQKSYMNLFPINRLVNYEIFQPKTLYF